MRTDLDHLPKLQQDELARVVQILMEEFERATSRATQPSRRNGKIYKIILFGSYARQDWVDEPEKGYQSDFDLLVVVSHPDLTEISDYWYIAEDRILRDPAIGRPVNIIVHSLDEVNHALRHGEYFWVDIAQDGIALYQLPNHELATPKPVCAKDALAMAERYYDNWSSAAFRSIATATEQMNRSNADLGWRKDAAFSFHQAVERSYACFLLTTTFYFPRSHNIKFLRSISEDNDARLIGAWPRQTKIDRRRFELLKRAYVEARYSENYEISREDLDALSKSVQLLRNIVEQVSRERIEDLRRSVERSAAD